jgi:hypothetical protein
MFMLLASRQVAATAAAALSRCADVPALGHCLLLLLLLLVAGYGRCCYWSLATAAVAAWLRSLCLFSLGD